MTRVKGWIVLCNTLTDGAVMPSGRKNKVNLTTLHNFLSSIKNGSGWSQAPDGKSLISYLQKHFNYASPQSIQKKILRLGQLGVLEQHYSGRILFRVKVLQDHWEEPEINKPWSIKDKPGLTENSKIAGEEAKESSTKKRFLILIDYRNFEKGFDRNSFEKFSNFNWLIDPLLEEGLIGNIFVFVPSNYYTRTPVYSLSYRERAYVIPCPRQIEGGITKERDSVDARLESLGKWAIEHSDTTDLVIVGGDSDYQPLIVFAKWQQKRVRIISTKNALSSRLREMSTSPRIKIQEVI